MSARGHGIARGGPCPSLVPVLLAVLIVATAPGSRTAAQAPNADPHPFLVDPFLVVRATDGRTLLELALADEPRWTVRWNHSVSGILISDYYAWTEGRMLLTDSHTPAFDAGLGHIPGRGRQVSDGAGGYWILDLDEPVLGSAYWLRVGGPAVDHRIVHAGRVHSLSALAAGQRVRIAVETR